MRSHLPTRKNPLAAATSADDVGDPTLYVTLNADYVTPGFVKPGFDDDRRRVPITVVRGAEGWESKVGSGADRVGSDARVGSGAGRVGLRERRGDEKETRCELK